MSPWDALGIAPTGDRAVIRRAYAERLKQTRPDEDPEGFARLRSAYEFALAQSGRSPAMPFRDTEIEPTDADEPRALPRGEAISAMQAGSEPGEERVPPDAEMASRVQAILETTDTGDVAAAAEALEAARIAGLLSLQDDIALTNQLLLRMVTDRDLSGFAVFDAATRLGWYGAAERPFRSLLLDRLQARLDAERWLAVLRNQAGQWRYYFGSQQSAAARLLLGRGQIFLSWILPPDPPLRRVFAEYQIHAPWIAHRLDASRIASVGRMAGSQFVRMATLLWLVLPLLLLFLTVSAKISTGSTAAIFGLLVGARLRAFARPILLVAGVVVALGVLGSHDQHAATRVAPSAVTDPIVALTNRAEAGDMRAAVELGERYVTGNGVAADARQAAVWFRLAKRAQPAAATWLGYLYDTGQGVAQNWAEARDNYQDAAERGDPIAQCNLAFMLHLGRGGSKDAPAAFQWYLRAARQGYPRGLNGVGYAYLIGDGVVRDPERALLWLRAAADSGQPNAMQSLADVYWRGEGVEPSPVLAYYWASLALRKYPKDDERLPSARAALQHIATQLDDQRKSMIAEDVEVWTAQPGRAPE
jgi:TPR repeat protein